METPVTKAELGKVPMARLNAARGLRSRGFSPLKPVLAAGAVVGVLAMVLLAVVTLGLALLIPGARRRVRVFRAGGVPPRPVPAPEARPEAAPGAASAEDSPSRTRSYAEVLEVWPLLLAASLLTPAVAQAKLLVPMDDAQANHLKAYGLTFWVLERGVKCEWLLNYRGGSFLLPEDAATIREANIRGVTSQPISGADEAKLRATIADENMEAIVLEKAPKIAVYIPANTPPWDDAVTRALE